MNIDKNKLKNGLWYEGKNGEFIPHDGKYEPPENAYTYHVCFPMELTEEIYIIRDDNGNIVDKPIGDRRLMTAHTHIGGGNSDVIIAMVQSGDYTLSEALAVFGNACERCMNALCYKYLNGKEGYPEHSEQWKRCNTVCDFCRDTKEREENA